jgi:preprotein translocase subunit SecF
MEYIGAEINDDIIKKSINAIFLSIILMFIYLILRFDLYFALSGIISLFHNIIIILCIISYFKIELNLLLLSAIFALFGYSVNDTVVIFDRIRENLNLKNNNDITSIINLSLNSTLSRTIKTSLSTILVVIILFIFNTDLYYFSLILNLGIIIGTYSSIFISTFYIYFLTNLKVNKNNLKESPDS